MKFRSKWFQLSLILNFLCLQALFIEHLVSLGGVFSERVDYTKAVYSVGIHACNPHVALVSLKLFSTKLIKTFLLPPRLNGCSKGLAMSCKTLTMICSKFCSCTTFSARILLLNNWTLTWTTRFDNCSTARWSPFCTRALAIFW